MTHFVNDDEADALVLQRDGKIVVSGAQNLIMNQRGDFALARYNTDGTLDARFGHGGKVTTSFTDGHDEAWTLTLQRDGKILAVGGAGFVLREHGDFALARYLPNGDLDPYFGMGGKVTTDFDRSFDNARAVAIQPDGKIVAAGEATHVATMRDIGVARYSNDD